MVLSFIVYFRVLIPTMAHRSGVSCIIHIEFVFAINIAAKVFRQVCNLTDLNFKIKTLVEKIARLISHHVFIYILISILFAGNYIDVNFAKDLIVCSKDWNLDGVIHQEG